MAPRFWRMAVSTKTRGGSLRFSRAAATTRGIWPIRATQFFTLVAFGSVDCVKSRKVLSLMYSL
jgi:hypothetical protein